jgi:hypothetical protein
MNYNTVVHFVKIESIEADTGRLAIGGVVGPLGRGLHEARTAASVDGVLHFSPETRPHRADRILALGGGGAIS